MLDPALGGIDELWLRQVWFSRLRWIIPPACLALGFLVELLSGRRLFAPLPATFLAAALVAVNVVYRNLLHRWGDAPERHARELRALAHVQVLFDLLAATIAIHYSGGASSTF